MISIGIEWYTVLCIITGFASGILVGLAYMETK